MSSGAEFEEYVRSIYSILLNLKDEGILVTGGAKTFLRGISKAGVVLMFLPPGVKQTVSFIPIPITREELISEYYGENIPSNLK